MGQVAALEKGMHRLQFECDSLKATVVLRDQRIEALEGKVQALEGAA